MDALLDGLEETAGGEGGAEVVLESLRGLSVLLSVQYKRPISPRVVLALKPFFEKENWEMKLAAIGALGAIATNWHRSLASPNDDLIDHLMGCLPSLIIRLEDSNITVVKVRLHHINVELLCIIQLHVQMFIYADVYLCNRLHRKPYVKLQVSCKARNYRM